MNRFEQEYIKIINEWNSNLLLEANLKSLIPNIQQQLIGNKSYSELTDNEKQELQNSINKQLDDIEQQVNNITDNKQYQSWIYQILKNKEVNYGDLNPLKSLILDFEKLSKRPDIKPNQKNIQNYSTLNDLKEFIDSFKEEHKLQNNIYKNLKKVYSNDEFTVYFINKDQYKECKKLFGGNEYFNTGWCTAKNKEYFNQYINENPDKYDGYFVFIKDNRPYALLHYGSKQFKDTSDETLETTNPNIIDCLIHINNNLNDYKKGDIEYYSKQIFLKENPNSCKADFIAFQIGGKYNPKTNKIDCKGNKVLFKNEWLDENGTFNFNLINTSDDWSNMFFGCKNLTKLPDNFTIPDGVKNCSFMFSKCKNLTKLLDNFNIPNSVTDCSGMFERCTSLTKLPDNFSIHKNIKYCILMFTECINLTKLPDNFTIPNGVIDCHNIFSGCTNLIKLPDNFNIPNSVKVCSYMFYECTNLIKLPNNFNIPNSVKDCSYMFYYCENLNKLPDIFSIPSSVRYCSNMFYKCKHLIKLPNNFSIPKNSNYNNIFSNSGLENKYNIKDLLR